MNNIMTTYKRNGIPILIPQCQYGISMEPEAPYQFPEGHPCHGCPYTLQTNVPSCMFPSRADGGCLWHDLNNPPPQKAADRIFEFIEVLERVKKLKGYK